MRKWPRHFLIVLIVVIIACTLLYSRENNKDIVIDELCLVGGSLPADIENVLIQMNRELRGAIHIQKAGLDNIIVSSDDGSVYGIEYMDKCLSLNGSRVIPRVVSFTLDYRNDMGRIIIRPDRNFRKIEHVSYTLKIQNNKGQEVYATSEIQISACTQ